MTGTSTAGPDELKLLTVKEKASIGKDEEKKGREVYSTGKNVRG